LLHQLAWACGGLVLAITTLSAFLRLSHAGLDCTPWPACYAHASGAATEGGLVGTARVAHRLVASLTLLLVIALVVATLRRPDLRAAARIARGLLALTLFLAVLGRFSAGTPSPVVAWANAATGLALFALSAMLVAVTRRPAARERAMRARRWTGITLALAALQVAFGAWASVQHAAADCGAFAACGLHRWLAVPVVAAVLASAVALRRAGAGGALAATLALLVLAQAAAGVAMLAWAMPLPLALAHNVLAALLLGALAAGAVRR
jgi:cytochrome c oxidase assembly protein subunit 15